MHSTSPGRVDSKRSNLKQRFVNAARWTLVGHVLAQVLRFASNLVLTRLLAPDMFGVMAVGYMVFTGFVMLSDLGTFGLVSQSKRGQDPKFLNVIWVVQIVRGVLIMLAALALSGLLALDSVKSLFPPHSVYADPRIPGLIAVLSLFGVASGFESTKSWFARRNLSLASLTKIELASQVATTVFIVTWAAISPSIWALAMGWIFGVLFKTVLSHVALPGPPNRIEWDASAFQEIIHFGKWAMLSSLISFLQSCGDRILLGGYLDAKAMGAYSIALLLVTALQDAVLRVTGLAVLPALSEVARERPAELKHTIYRIRRPLDIACLVPAGALFVLGKAVVNFLYDSRYAPAGWMLTLLALTLVTTSFNVFDQCLIALGRMKLLSALNAARLVSLYVFVPLGYGLFGATGAIAALPCVALVNTGILMVVQAKLGFLDVRRELVAVPLFAAGLLAGWLVSLVLPWLGLHV
jgi:O-antigen/teichoic acid export membrane protein